MDPATYTVVYVDRRASQEKDLHRDDLPSLIQQVQDGSILEHEEVVSNLQAIFSVFNSVSICTSGPSCVSRLSIISKQQQPTPTILLLDIPKTDHEEDVGGVMEGRHDSGIANGPSDPMYGLSLLRFVCLEIEKSRISDLVIPVAVISDIKRNESEGSDIEKSAFSWVDESEETARSTRCVDCGALDVLISPFSKDRVKGLPLHCYRAAKKHICQYSRARKLSWVGVPEVQKPKSNEYAYLREKMVSELMTDIIKPKKAPTTSSGLQIQVSPSRQELIRRVIGRWHFSAHEFTDEELLYCAHVIFEHVFSMPEVDEFKIPADRLTDFLIASRSSYNDQIPYHNFRHVVDVLQATFVMLVCLGSLPPYAGATQASVVSTTKKSTLASLIRPADALVLLVSAIGHDVGHPGVNNAFLVKLKAPLAQVYNDKSVLESFHCAAFSQVLRKYWPETQTPDMRKLMIDTILATDMGLHFDYMGRLEKLKDLVAGSDIGSWDERTVAANRTLVCSILIKCADISNVARGHDCAAQWATILIEEFSRQASMEQDLGIPSSLVAAPIMGNLLALAQSQTGFMNLFAIPLFKTTSEVMPALKYTVDELLANIQKWTFTIKDCEERNISSSSSPPVGVARISRPSDEPEITLIHSAGEGSSNRSVTTESKVTEPNSRRSSFEWSSRSGQSSIINRDNGRSSTSSPFVDSRPPSGARNRSRRSSGAVPADQMDRPLSSSSTEHSYYKGTEQRTPNQNGNGYIRSRKEKASYGAFPPAEQAPPPIAYLGDNLKNEASTAGTDRPRSSPPDLGDANEKTAGLQIVTGTVSRRPSRFFKVKFWNKKKHKEED